MEGNAPCLDGRATWIDRGWDRLVRVSAWIALPLSIDGHVPVRFSGLGFLVSGVGRRV